MGPRGDDGYHPVTSLMVALDGLSDALEVRRAGERRVRCPGIEGPANLVWAALDALEAEAGRALPVEVEIDKRIPSQAGLGGGSSDAAAALVAVDRLYGLGLGEVRLEAVAARVGSDVPFFVRGGAQWAEGRGERLRPASAPEFAALLVKGEAGLSTAAVYRAFDRLPAPAPTRPASRRPGCPPSPPGRATTSGRRRSRSRRASAPPRARSRRPGPARCSCAAADRASRGSTRIAAARRRRRGDGPEEGSAPW